MAKSSLHTFRNSWRIKFLGASLIVLGVCEFLLIIDVVTEHLKFDVDFFLKYHSAIEATAVFFVGLSLIVIGADFWRLII